jgi:hypothetical protein
MQKGQRMTSDNVLFLVLGTIFGYIMGLLTNQIHKTKAPKSVAVMHQSPKTWVARFKQLPGVTSTNIGMVLILALVVWAAITSQLNSNHVADQQRANAKVVDCSVKFLNDTISALSDRTALTPRQNQASLELQAAQEKFFTSINPRSNSLVVDYDTALRTYQAAYNKYINLASQSNTVLLTTDYPTSTQLRQCLGQ